MKSDLLINLAYFLTIIIIVTIPFLSFYPTPLGHFLTQLIINLIGVVFPSIGGLNQIILPLIFGFIVGITGIIYLIGRRSRVKLLCLFSFLIFLPSALPFSSISWFSASRTETGLLWFSPFVLITISGITLFFGYIFLNFLSKIKETKEELFLRGGNVREINAVLAGSFFYTLLIEVVSVFLSTIALIIILLAQPYGASLLEITPYATLIFGVGGIGIFSILVYYYLIQNKNRIISESSISPSKENTD